MSNVKNYIDEVIGVGDEGSSILAQRTVETLNNNSYVDIVKTGKNGLVVVRPPENQQVVVHVSGGDHSITDRQYVHSVIDDLLIQSKAIGSCPIGFANVIDSHDGDVDMLEMIADQMVQESNEHGIAVLNGENAILGNRVPSGFTMTGVMISLINKEFSGDSTSASFDPEGKPVYINADGVGTKTELHERSGNHANAVLDYAAMNLDDAAKIAADIKVLAGMVETKGEIGVTEIQKRFTRLNKTLGIQGVLGHADVGSRIASYKSGLPAFNLSGAVVSTIDEDKLDCLPRPYAGDYLIAIRKKESNPRSNGISAIRRGMTEWMGNDWHSMKKGAKFLTEFSEPSAIFYPLFKELLDFNYATSVYHMSGGSFEGKLAKPIAEQGLFVQINEIYNPGPRMMALLNHLGTSAEEAYKTWPMGNDGFVTAVDAVNAIKIIERYGFEAKVVGQLVDDGRTGIELLSRFNNETVRYAGR